MLPALLLAASLASRPLDLGFLTEDRLVVLFEDALSVYRVGKSGLVLESRTDLPGPFLTVRAPAGLLRVSEPDGACWALTNHVAEASLFALESGRLVLRERAAALPWPGAPAGLRYRAGTNVLETGGEPFPLPDAALSPRIASALASLAALGIAARVPAALDPRYGGDITLALPGALPSVTPEPPLSVSDRLVFGLVHEPLVRLDPGGLPAPALARTLVPAPEGREWTLALDPEARFHDGAPVTAEDAVRSLGAFLSSGSTAARRLEATLAPDGLAAADAGHVVLRFRAPTSLPLAPLAAAAITSPRGAGAGPFTPTHEVPGDRLALTAFASHVRGRPYLDRITVVRSPDGDRARADLATGRVDAALAEPGISALAGMLLLVLDPRHPAFAAPEARAVVASALDTEKVVPLVPGSEASRSLLVPALLHAPGTERAEPAWRAFTGALRLAVATDVPPAASQRVVAHLDALGFRVDVEPMSPVAARNSGRPARLLLFLPEAPEAGLSLRELASLAPQVPAAEAALDAADSEADPDRRRAWLVRGEAALRAASCLIPLASMPVAVGVRTGLLGVRVDPGGRVVLEDAWLAP